MPGKGNYLETLLLRHVFNGTTSAGSSIWAALHNATLVDIADGSEISTVGTNYNRVAVAQGSANWSSLVTPPPTSVSNSTVINKAVISFASAASSYTVESVGLWSASNAGNLLYMADITSKVIEIGDVPTISSGAIVVTED